MDLNTAAVYHKEQQRKCANSLGPFTHEHVVVGGSVSQLMTETTPRYISIHTFRHRNASLARCAQCGTFPASGEGRSLLLECVLCAHLETRRGESVPAVSTLFYDPGGGGGAAIFAFFVLFFFLPWDGEDCVGLRCHGPAGQHRLVFGRHAGVHPLEQLQHQVSRSGSRPTQCCCSVVFRGHCQ